MYIGMRFHQTLQVTTLGKLFTHHSFSVRSPSLGALPTKYPNPNSVPPQMSLFYRCWLVFNEKWLHIGMGMLPINIDDFERRELST